MCHRKYSDHKAHTGNFNIILTLLSFNKLFFSSPSHFLSCFIIIVFSYFYWPRTVAGRILSLHAMRYIFNEFSQDPYHIEFRHRSRLHSWPFAQRLWFFFFFLTGTKLLHDWHVPKKRNHNLHRRTISSLQPQTAAAWLWRSSRPHCYMCLWFGCGVCVSAVCTQVGTCEPEEAWLKCPLLAEASPCVRSVPWGVSVGLWALMRRKKGNVRENDLCVIDRQHWFWIFLFGCFSASPQSWFSTNIVSVCVLQFRKERGEEGLS